MGATLCELLELFYIVVYSFVSLRSAFGDSAFRAEVTEESPIGTVIHGVAEYLNALGPNNEVQYQLLGDEGVSRLVTLNPTTGELRVRGRIDREAICPDQNGNMNRNGIVSSGGSELYSGSNLLNPKLDNSQGFLECVQTLNILLVSQRKTPTGVAPGVMDDVPRASRILIQLVIRDINDNAPMWALGSHLEVGFVETPSSGIGWNSLGPSSVPATGASSGSVEDATAKNTRTIDRALDPDLGPNSTIVYRLLGPGAEYFRIEDGSQRSSDETGLSAKLGTYLSHTTTSLTRTGPLQIRPIMPLDRETEEFAGRDGLFNLTLLATDMGIPPKTGSTTLLIHVIDVNDHAPVFHNDVYQHPSLGRLNRIDDGLVVYRPTSGSIRETIPVGSLVIQLNATDKDVGTHAQLVYAFCPCDRSSAMDYFKVDRDSGQISVIKPLDYDHGPRQFQFKVIAKDSAPEPYTLTGTAMVEITLTDENDEAPVIHVMLLQHPSGAEVRSTVISPTESAYPATVGGKIKFSGEYTTSINENPQPETIVAYIQVSDRDHHGQDQVHCRLGPTDNFTLQLDPVNSQTQTNYANPLVESPISLNRQDFRLVTGTGMIGYSSENHPLDREVTPVQRVTITCTDSVGNSAYVLIHVNLLDINDHEPQFINNGLFAFQLAENQELVGGKPLWLGRTMATDMDLGDNALITYHLPPQDELGSTANSNADSNGFESHPSRLFDLDTQTGNLYAKTVFDRESAPSGGVYRLRVLAVDNGTPKLTGTATVEVYILDVNDWAPQFTKDVYTFSVPEDARIQEVIGVVEAIDRDADSHGKITYQLVPHTRQKREIDHLKGRETRPVRQVPNELQENPVTEVTEPVNHFSSAEDKLSFGPDKNERDTDATDSGIHHVPTSTERINPGYFSVDRLTGKIRLIRRLDRESIAFFSLEIVATDAPPVSVLPVQHQLMGAFAEGRNHTTIIRTPIQMQSLSTTTTVVIAVTDVNDNAPVFRRPNTSTAIQLRLHETLGRQLLIIEATDADEGENARVTYQIRSEVPRPPDGPGTGFFAVDETSGVLFLAKPLNSSTTHRLVVEACDNGSGTTRRCTLSPSIRITVSDQNSPNTDLGLYSSRPSGAGGSVELPFDLDSAATHRINPSLQAGRRNELVVVCLVVVFSILLLATMVLVACLVHRRGTRTWFLGRSNGSNTDIPSYGKEAASPKANITGRSGMEPWPNENSCQNQADFALDTKFEACKSNTQYDQPNDMKYVARDNLINGATYPTECAGYLPHTNAMKLFPGSPISGPVVDGQSVTHMAPMRFRPVHSPPVDYMLNAVDMPGAMLIHPRSQHNSEISELLTQSSYKPPSPDYQSLDVMWHRVPRPDLGAVTRLGRYRNPVPNQATTYAMGHGNSSTYTTGPNAVTHNERGLFYGPNEVQRTSEAVHTYYEITGASQVQSPARQARSMPHRSRDLNGVDIVDDDVLENWGGAQAETEPGTKLYTSAATLGRPATGKGKRRSMTKADSMYSTKAGDLALHSSKKRAAGWVKKREVDTVGKNDDDEGELGKIREVKGTEINAYGKKPTGQYTYQAYREGTFV